MTEHEVAVAALIEIRRLYFRSNKRDKNTCRQMYLTAEKALEEIGASGADAQPPDPSTGSGYDAASVRARWG